MKNRKRTRLALLGMLFPLVACLDSQPDEYGESANAICTPTWELAIPAAIPCHMDIDRHLLYREAEAYGVDEFVDSAGCFTGSIYERVELGSNRCTWPLGGVSISSRQCADQLYRSLTGGTPMPEEVYDKNACPGQDGGGAGGGGGGVVDPQ